MTDEAGGVGKQGETAGEERAHIQRLQLKYCERCGTLGVQPQSGAGSLEAGERAEDCGVCRTSLRWLGEVRS